MSLNFILWIVIIISLVVCVSLDMVGGFNRDEAGIWAAKLGESKAYKMLITTLVAGGIAIFSFFIWLLNVLFFGY